MERLLMHPYKGLLDRFFGRDLFDAFGDLMSCEIGESRIPLANYRETEGELVLDLEVPGLSREDLEIKAEKGYLVVEGEKECENEKRSFKGVYSVPGERQVDYDAVSATHKEGILSVHFPLREKSLENPDVRKIEITEGD
jgi:HSP20 family protein